MNSEVKDFISNCNACNGYLQNNSKELFILFQQNLEPNSNGCNDCFLHKFLDYSRLPLRLLRIRHIAKQAKSCKCDSMLQRKVQTKLEYLMLMLLTLLDIFIAKSLSNLQKNGSLNAAHQIYIIVN